jgi:formylglycine-generating enzyme required for sulfatase activity
MTRRHVSAAVAIVLAAALAAQAASLRCPPDSVKVGTICVDAYESSVWVIDPGNTTLVRRVQSGRATRADLTAGGASLVSSPACNVAGFPDNFPANGSWTPVAGSSPPSPGVYAVSIPGVAPSRCITWLQANQACLLSGKRLLTNREWQGAAAGTPDPDAADDGSTTCVTSALGPADTGSRASCRSVWGAFDMVGNVNEWVADWGDRSVSCTSWPASLGGDFSCVAGPGTTGNPGETSGTLSLPGAINRGGAWFDGTSAGIFAIDAGTNPSLRSSAIGFRCAR